LAENKSHQARPLLLCKEELLELAQEIIELANKG
jgi:hypothetical protein